jgi:hypothetical protein
MAMEIDPIPSGSVLSRLELESHAVTVFERWFRQRLLARIFDFRRTV